MLKGLMNYGAGRLMGIGAAIAAPYGFDLYDAYIHYAPVEARVTRVQDSCYMEKRSGGQLVKSEVYSCRSAESAVKNNFIWKGANVVYDIAIAFEYVSPADGQLHADARTLTAWPRGKAVSPGDVLWIRASRNDPEATRGI